MFSRAGDGVAERPPLIVDADISRVRRPCDRVDPPLVHWLAGADAAGVGGPLAFGHCQEDVGRLVCRQPDAGDGLPDG
jgi:hypothetical protein